MDPTESPAVNVDEAAAGSPPPSPTNEDPDAAALADEKEQRKKKARKKRKTTAFDDGLDDGEAPVKKPKKPKARRKDKDDRPKKRKQSRKGAYSGDGGLTPAQMAVNEQMRRALEEDQYSANGSIVDTDSDDDDHQHIYKGESIRLDRNYLMQATRKHLWMEKVAGGNASGPPPADDTDGRRKARKKKKKGKSSKDDLASISGKSSDEVGTSTVSASSPQEVKGIYERERDEGSIFGQTAGSSNATWVECDKCKKWRRLRGVVDERKLPTKWYCSMNKNDPERSRCSAPEEEYDAAHTPESAADSRTRKHFRVWVRRLQCNEAYESKQTTMTRGKKRAAAANSKDPYEWIRCCNPSCGKWRAILRIMDAKTNVVDGCTNGEWYCVMNTWDEKMASCAAPQENLPAVGCPPWVMQDDN